MSEQKSAKKKLFIGNHLLGISVGTLRSEDSDGSENVAEKVNSRSFNLHHDYSKSLTLSNVAEPSKTWNPMNHIH